MKYFKLTQGGDTIVEVLIAMAVISSVLGGAYASANRNSKSAQQSQEHSRALKVAETQLELLKAYATNFHDQFTSDPNLNGSFCLQTDTAGNDVKIKSYDSSTAGECKVDDNGIADRYSTEVTKDAVTNIYTVKISWDGIKGGQDQVGLVYRVF